MTNIDIANGLVFQALGVNKDSFEGRLMSQKKVFLLQELGINMGYSYNWYVHGPYSPDLTTYIYNNIDVLIEQDLSKYCFSDTVQEKIDAVNSLGKVKPDSLDVPSWYELLASVVYIQKKWKKDDAFSCLVEYKPQFSREHYNVADNELRRFGFYS